MSFRKLQRAGFEYNSLGKVTRKTDPLGRTTILNYFPNGIDLQEVRQVNGQTTELVESRTYNSQHQPLTMTDTAGQTTNYTYLPDGRLQTVVTPPRAGLTQTQRTTTYSYYPDSAPTGAGKLQTVTGPATGATTGLTYDGYGRIRTTTDPDNYTLTFDYDALDRPTKTTYPDNTYDQTVYNRLDAEQQRDRLGRWSYTLHDALRRVASTRDAAGRTVTQEWCNCGSLDKLIDPNGNATTWDRDLQGRATKETRADNTFTAFAYETTTSRLRTRTDARNQTTTYSYKLDDNLSQVAYTNAVIATPNVSYSQDPVYNRLISMTDGTGTTSYSYHPPGVLGAGQIKDVDGPLANDTVSYSYDELGRVATRGLSSFSTTSSYDSLGRLTTLASPVGSFGWAYVNATGRPQTITYPNNQVTTYSYFNNAGDQRLQQIKHQQTAGGAVLSQFDYTYDAVGSIKTWRQQLGASPAKSYDLWYDRADQLAQATQKDASTQAVLKNYGYAYDPAGNRTVEAQDSSATTATYNNRNELMQQAAGAALPVAGTVSEPATVSVSGAPAAVDAANRFAGQTPLTGGTQNFTVVATDPSGNARTNTYQVNVTGTARSFTYDPNGNLASKTEGAVTMIYDWDAENRLAAVKQGATTLASFVYDGRGRRAQKTAAGVTHTYLYDQDNIVEERASSGQIYDIVQGPAIDRPLAQRDQTGVVSYYLADHLGSVVQMTNNVGAVTLTREYDPWGNLVQGSGTAGFAFTGREWDSETSAYYYRARYYDPKIGRFISEDPIGLLGDDVNFYAYVQNDPVGFADPSGMARSKPTWPKTLPGIPCRKFVWKDYITLEPCFIIIDELQPDCTITRRIEPTGKCGWVPPKQCPPDTPCACR